MTQINNFISLWFMMVSAALIALGSFACKYLIQIDGIYLTMLVSFVGGGILMWWVVSISSFQELFLSLGVQYLLGWCLVYLHNYFSL